MQERKPSSSRLGKNISRRDLLKGAAVLAGGAYLTEACGGGVKEFPTIPERKYPLFWQTEFNDATSIYRILPKKQIEVILSFDERFYEKSILDPKSGKETGRSGLPVINVLGDGPELLPELEEIKISGTFYVGDEEIDSSKDKRESWDLPEGYGYPYVYGDVVIAASAETEGEVVDYEYYGAFDLETGTQLWKRKVGFNGGFYFNETGFYEISGDNVKFADKDKRLNILIRRIDLHTGEQYWKRDNITKSEVAVPLWADNNNLVVVSNHDVVSLNNQNGKIFGKLKFDGSVFTFDPFAAVHRYFEFDNLLEGYDIAAGPKKVFLPIFHQLVELDKASGVLTYVNAAEGSPVDHAIMSDNLLIVASGRQLYAYDIAE